MVSSTSSRREEDEMLRYAHVERSVEKHYAIRYKGYVDELPYFFLRDCLNKRIRDFRDEIEFKQVSDEWRTRQADKSANWQNIISRTFPVDQNQICRDGDWIIVGDRFTIILSDDDFRLLYKPVRDLDF